MENYRRTWYGRKIQTRQVDSYSISSPMTSDVRIAPSRSSVVDSDSALSIAAVYRSVSILATSVSQLKLYATKAGQRIVTQPSIIRNPDLYSNTPAFLEMTITSMSLTGNAYWKITTDANGIPTNLEVLNPNLVMIARDASGNLRFNYGDRSFSESEIKHLKLLRVPGSDYGLGPIQATRSELSGVLDLHDFQSSWFRDSGVPTGVLSTDQALTQERADEYKARWDATSGGLRVLGSGLSYSPSMLTPEDAMFISVMQFSVTNIARLFGVPSSYLLAAVEGSNLTYSNIQQVDTSFVKYTLMAYIKEIEEAMSDLLPRGTYATFDVDGFLRADIKTRYDVYAIALSNGIMTVEEIRNQEGLN